MNIIQISSAEELARIGIWDDYPLSGDYELTTDIDLSGYPDWHQIGGGEGDHGMVRGDQVFNGTFDGKGYTISNLKIRRRIERDTSVGLFGIIASDNPDKYASVSNLLLKNVDIDIEMTRVTSTGALAGEVNGYSLINNIAVVSGRVSSNVVGRFSNIQGESVGLGGIIGESRTADSEIGNRNIRITNVYNAARVIGSNYHSANNVGGILGRIRAGNISALENAVNVGSTNFEDASNGSINKGFGINTSDSSADSISNVYYRRNFGMNLILNGEEKYLRKTKAELSNGSLSMGNSFTIQQGYYPIPNFANENSEAFNQTDFKVPGDLSINRDYIKPGEIFSIGGAPAGSVYEFFMINQITGEEKSFSNLTGEYLPTKEDLENVIYVDVNGFDRLTRYISELPVMYFDGETSYYDIIKGDYKEFDLLMQGNDEFPITLYKGLSQIRLRGNATASRPKRPFKLRLDSKTDLFGFGSDRHWVLLSNDLDQTLLRNKLLYDFSGDIGNEVYMKSKNAVMFYNDGYYGVYQICEQIRVSDVRVDIYSWDNLAEDAAEAIAKSLYPSGSDRDEFEEAIYEELASNFIWIDAPHQITFRGATYVISNYVSIPEDTNGGYITEMDFYAINDNSLAKITTAYRQPIYFNSPEPTDNNGFMTNSLWDYARRNVQSFEYAIHNDDFFFRNSDTHFYTIDAFKKNGVWQGVYEEREYIDDTNDGNHYSQIYVFDTLVRNFVFCEYAMNWDSMKNSFFTYKNIGEIGKFGPQWDFDWCWGLINQYNIDTYRPTIWHTTSDYFANEQFYQSVQFNRMLIRDPYFLVRAYELYHKIRPTYIEDMIKDEGLIDSYREELEIAASANDSRWEHTFVRDYIMQHGLDFEGSVDMMKHFIVMRMQWLDRQFESIDTLIKSLGAYTPSSEITIADIDMSVPNQIRVTANVRRQDITSVVFQVNGINQYSAEVTNGSAFISFNDDILERELGVKNVVVALAMKSDGTYLHDIVRSDRGNYNLVISNYMIFEKEFIREPIQGAVIINQVYGAGNKGDSAISNSFVELYNATEHEISLEEYQLEYDGPNGMMFLSLSGNMLAGNSSFLVRGAIEQTTGSFAHVIETADLEWNVYLDNHDISMRLVAGGEIIDSVMFDDLSKQRSARRIDFKNTGNNVADFEYIQYNQITPAQVQRYRPRSRVDGSWTHIDLSGTVMIAGIAAVGQTLTAVLNGVSGSGIGYQWKVDFTDVDGETGNTYTVRAEDIGKRIMVVVTNRAQIGFLVSNRLLIPHIMTPDVREGLLAEYKLYGFTGMQDSSGNNLPILIMLDPNKIIIGDHFTRMEQTTFVLPENIFSQADTLKNGFSISFNIESSWDNYWAMSFVYFRDSSGIRNNSFFLTQQSNVGTLEHPFLKDDGWLDTDYHFGFKGRVRCTVTYNIEDNLVELYINDGLGGRSFNSARAFLTEDAIKSMDKLYIGYPNDDSTEGRPPLSDANIAISDYRIYDRPLSYSEVLNIYDEFSSSTNKWPLHLAIENGMMDIDNIDLASLLERARQVEADPFANQEQIDEAWYELVFAQRTLG